MIGASIISKKITLFLHFWYFYNIEIWGNCLIKYFFSVHARFPSKPHHLHFNKLLTNYLKTFTIFLYIILINFNLISYDGYQRKCQNCSFKMQCESFIVSQVYASSLNVSLFFSKSINHLFKINRQARYQKTWIIQVQLIFVFFSLFEDFYININEQAW